MEYSRKIAKHENDQLFQNTEYPWNFPEKNTTTSKFSIFWVMEYSEIFRRKAITTKSASLILHLFLSIIVIFEKCASTRYYFNFWSMEYFNRKPLFFFVLTCFHGLFFWIFGGFTKMLAETLKLWWFDEMQKKRRSAPGPLGDFCIVSFKNYLLFYFLKKIGKLPSILYDNFLQIESDQNKIN